MAITPLRKMKKVHKKTKQFIRCEFHDYPGRLKATWRRPRGQDNTCRRRLRGANRLVKCGYGSNKKTR
jgi:large subunit ribosomal protein L32e